ncbi:hypothetical protein BU17DRAFT_64885 [Hysterangium stoloniferum]|nr:hypothetical protein BU17DRAFT_64885 [Hysterangium stoloniferum]
MATKIIISFAGPLTPTVIEGWLCQCEDRFSIYTSTKTEKAPDLNIEMKIRLMGTNMQELTIAAWWNAGHMEFLRLESWETFEKQIRNRFMPKGYKMVALHTFFLCAQNHLPFLQYSATLADAHNALGPNIIMAAIYKYQLLFHAHHMLVLRIMVIPDFVLEDISFNNLVALMSMQWESFVMEILATHSTLRTSPMADSISPIPPLPQANEPQNSNPLSLTDCERLSAVGGCWRCQKVPTDSRWTPHIGHTCPGDPSQGVSPSPDFVPPPPVIKNAVIRKHKDTLLPEFLF